MSTLAVLQAAGCQGAAPRIYNASKATVIHLTRSLATGWATNGVRVNSISPAKKEFGRAQKELERLQKAEKDREDAEKSELERAQERIAGLERKEADGARRLGEVTLRAAAQTEALRLGYRRPERAYREIDLADVEFDDEGEPTNLRRLLEAELKARPELKASAPLPPDTGAGERGRTTLSREHVREMARKDPRWVNQHWDEVQDVLGRPGR